MITDWYLQVGLPETGESPPVSVNSNELDGPIVSLGRRKLPMLPALHPAIAGDTAPMTNQDSAGKGS